DEMLQRGQIGLIDAQLGQRILHRTGDALTRVGECAVEVEEKGGVVHGRAPIHNRNGREGYLPLPRHSRLGSLRAIAPTQLEASEWPQQRQLQQPEKHHPTTVLMEYVPATCGPFELACGRSTQVSKAARV